MSNTQILSSQVTPRTKRSLGQLISAGLSQVGYRVMIFLIARLPYPLSYRAGRAVGDVKYALRKKANRRQAANMRVKLNAGPEQVEAWLKRSFELRISEDVDTAYFSGLTKEKMGRMMRIKGLEHLRHALEQGRGAILYSGHFWGRLTFMAVLSVAGFNPVIVRLETESRQAGLGHRLAVRFWAGMEKLGCHFLLVRQGAKNGAYEQLIEALKKNQVVLMLIDMARMGSRRNLDVEFFGEQVPFPLGPASLAQATGAPLLNYCLYRDDTWVPQIAEIAAPFYVQDDVAAATQQCAACLEATIRAHPADWGPWHIFTAWKDSE